MMTLTSSDAPTGRQPVATLVKWIDAAITGTSIVLAVTALVIMFIALMAEVVVRYVTNQGMGWPTEMPNLLFPWLVMSGVVLAAQRGQHIAVTAILPWLGRTGQRALLMLLQAGVVATFFYLAWVGLDVIEITGTEVYPVTGVSAKWAYMALIVGFVGLGLTALTTLVHLAITPNPLDVRVHQLSEDL